jgi:YbbR domain-containing protein
MPATPARPWWRFDRETLRRRLRSLIFENVGFKLLSVAFALATWSWVQGEQVVDIPARVAVDWTLPDSLARTEELPDIIFVTVRGSQVFARNVDRAQLKLKVDLHDASAGPQLVDFENRAIENMPQNVKVVSVSPAKVEFRLDEKVKKRVRVTPLTTGEPASGYRIVKVSVEPDHVEVEGPRSRLADVTELPTAAVDVSGVQEDKEEEVELNKVPGYVKIANAKLVVVKVDVEPLSTVKMFEDVPVVVRARGWNPQQDTVTIALEGPVAELEAIKHDDVMLVIQVEDNAPHRALRAGDEGGAAHYSVVFPKAPGVKVRSVRPETIRVQPSE